MCVCARARAITRPNAPPYLGSSASMRGWRWVRAQYGFSALRGVVEVRTCIPSYGPGTCRCALTTVVCHLCDYGALTNSLAESDMDHDHIMVQTTVQFWNLAIRTISIFTCVCDKPTADPAEVQQKSGSTVQQTATEAMCLLMHRVFEGLPSRSNSHIRYTRRI